jgi:hypothetical protein
MKKILLVLKTIFGKNQKTTVAGALPLVITEACKLLGIPVPLEVAVSISSLAIFLVGLLSKDAPSNSVPSESSQTPEPKTSN